MKTIDNVFIIVATVLQLGIAVLLLWAANTDSFNIVIASGQRAPEASPEIARLVSDYRQALGIAKEVFIDVGIALLCSSGLTAIVLFRQMTRHGIQK